jgi:hypothetical protein
MWQSDAAVHVKENATTFCDVTNARALVGLERPRHKTLKWMCFIEIWAHSNATSRTEKYITAHVFGLDSGFI